MTAQFPDSILFQGDSFSVTAIDGTGLFDPVAHGLEPKWIHTGCYRGYICHYALVEQRLVLRDLHIRTEDEPTRLNGVPPQQDKDGSSCHYRGLDIPVVFTGRLLIGADVIPNRPYLNMGFTPAWLYERVYDRTLRAGELLTAQDCSAAVAATRAEIITTAVEPAPGESTGDWITRTFLCRLAPSGRRHEQWPDGPSPEIRQEIS